MREAHNAQNPPGDGKGSLGLESSVKFVVYSCASKSNKGPKPNELNWSPIRAGLHDELPYR